MTRKTLLLLLLILSRFMVLGQNDSCAKTSSEVTYGGPQEEDPAAIIHTSDGGLLLVGNTNSFGAGGFDGYIVKLSSTGAIQWSKTYGGPDDDEFTRGIQTADGGYLLGGYTTSYGDPADGWLVKTDANGNLQWSKKYGDGNPNGERLWNLVQTADGGYAFSGDHKYLPGLVDVMVVRLDANGNILWATGFDSGGSDESTGITEDRDSLVVTAFYESVTGYDAVLMKLEETAGNIAWLQSWSFDSRTNRLGDIYKLPDGYLIDGVNSDGYGVTNPWENVVKTDFNGNLIFVQELHTTPITMNGYLSPTADGGYIVENYDQIFNPNWDVYITKVNNDGSIDWSREYVQPGQQNTGGIIPAPGGGYTAIANTNQNGNYDLLLIRTDTAGKTNTCVNQLITAYNRNPVVSPQTYMWPTIYSIAFKPSLTINPTVTSPSTVESALCLSTNLCLHLQLTGADSICNAQNPVSYASIRDSGCVSPIQWSIDSNFANILTQTDSTIQLQYKQPGAVTLYGQITSTCGIVQDSLPILIYHPTPVSLGDDSSFCPGGSVVLNAGSGFQSYTWNNGANTQEIVASTTGTYWVAALNPNSNCLSTDTVTVTEYPAPVVNIGPDTVICQDSTYKFSAGNGFSSYLWQDSTTNPFDLASRAGVYWVIVTDQNGCTASDTARILGVDPNPKDFLEPTAEVCSAGQLPVEVGAIGTWSAYLWSNGSTAPIDTIAVPGGYWLQVTSGAGCTARDTITVTGKACPFGIFFPNAFTPGNGTNNIFRPIVYTELSKFYMAVYNRWGTKVFETTDPFAGWDGTFNGQPQPTGAFVWYAQYQQLSGHGQTTIQKGTVMLIR